MEGAHQALHWARCGLAFPGQFVPVAGGWIKEGKEEVRGQSGTALGKVRTLSLPPPVTQPRIICNNCECYHTLRANTAQGAWDCDANKLIPPEKEVSVPQCRPRCFRRPALTLIDL